MKRPNVRAACLKRPPLRSKRNVSGAAAGPLSPLFGYWKLRQQMPKKEKPLSKWEESFHHRLLNRGAVPESQFTIVGFLLFSWCVSPAKTRSTVRKWLFFPAFLWSGDLRSFQCQCDYTARWHVSRQDREGTCFWIRNWQPNQIYLLRLSTEIWVDFLGVLETETSWLSLL